MTLVPGSALDFPFEPKVSWSEEPGGDFFPDEALVFVCHERRLLVRKVGERAEVPTLAELGAHAGLPDLPSLEDMLYLGRLAGRPMVAMASPLPAEHRQAPEAPEDHLYGHLRKLHPRLEESLFWIAARAMQIVDWDLHHRFCGRCATATERHGSERSRRCPACGLTVYPRLAPAVIVLVEKGDRILLARGPHLPPGMYSTLAGFVEPGESLEQTVLREIEEEVGIVVGDIRYFGSQPWPFPHSLMVGFRARWLSGEIRIDDEEIEAADWYSAEALPQIPPRLSIARSLIDAFLAERAGARRQDGRQ